MIDEQLTTNWNIREFACHDGTGVPYNLLDNARELAENLQVLRDHIGKPIHCISGYRNPTYNKRIGGAKRSYHMKAMAADIKVKGMTPTEVKAVIVELMNEGKMKAGGIGVYRTFTHVDIRGRKARW